MQALLVYCTCPSLAVAESLANQLLHAQLCACINIVAAHQVLYRWQGKIVTDTESLLQIKTQASCYDALETHIIAQHPYEVPEIIAVPIVNGSKDYLEWLNKATSV